MKPKPKLPTDLFRQLVAMNQRGFKPAYRQLIHLWRSGELQAATPVNPNTGLPCGWSYSNFIRSFSAK